MGNVVPMTSVLQRRLPFLLAETPAFGNGGGRSLRYRRATASEVSPT